MKGISCCVPDCQSKEGHVANFIQFFKLPVKPEERLQRWKDVIKRQWKLDGAASEHEKTLRVCSLHFVGGVVSDDPESPSYVPSIFPSDMPPLKQMPPPLKRIRKRKQFFDEIVREEESVSPETIVIEPDVGKGDGVDAVLIETDPKPKVTAPKPKVGLPVSYNLNWPGFGYMPTYIVDRARGQIYHEGKPLPASQYRLDSFHYKYVAVDDVLSLFPGSSMATAAKQLILLTENIEMSQSYRHAPTGEYFIHLNTLLAFIIICPFCPEFQRSRSALLRFLTDYPELSCLKCGFVQRDCRCKWAPDVLVKHPGPRELVAKVTDLTDNSSQTDVVSCPICKDPQAFKTAKNPMLVMPPGLKLNPGEKFSLTMQQNAAGGVQIKAGMCADDMPMEDTSVSVIGKLPGSTTVSSAASMLPLGGMGGMLGSPDASLMGLPGMGSLSSPLMANPTNSLLTSQPGAFNSTAQPLMSWNQQDGTRLPMMWPSMLPPSSLPSSMAGFPALSGTITFPRSMPSSTTMNSLGAPRVILPGDVHPREFLQPLRQHVYNPRKANQPAIVLRDPKEILMEEDIRRKKRKMDKLFDDKFVLAKPSGEDDKSSPKKTDTEEGKATMSKDKSDEMKDDERVKNKPETDKSDKSDELKDNEREKSKPETEKSDKKEEEATEEQSGKLSKSTNTVIDLTMDKSPGSEDTSTASEGTEACSQEPLKVPADVAGCSAEDSRSHPVGMDVADTVPDALSFLASIATGEESAITKMRSQEGLASGATADKLVSRTELVDSSRKDANLAADSPSNSPNIPNSDGAVAADKPDAATESPAVKDDAVAVLSEAVDRDAAAVTSGVGGDSNLSSTGDGDASVPANKDSSSCTQTDGANSSTKDGSDNSKVKNLDESAQSTKDADSSTHSSKQEDSAQDISGDSSSLFTENSLLGELTRGIEKATGKSLDAVCKSYELEQSAGKQDENGNSNKDVVNKDSCKEVAKTEEAQKGDTSGEKKEKVTEEGAQTPSTPSTPVPPPDVPSELIKKGYADFEFVPTGERMIRCVLFGCGQCFDTEECAKLHVKCHEAKGKGLQCYVCKDFSVQQMKWYNMERHLQEQHDQGKPESELHCRWCGLKFESTSELDSHIQFHYYSEYKCIHCSHHCFTWKHMLHHLKDCKDTQKQFYFNCPYCHLVFHTAPIQSMHISSHTDKGFVCCICKDDTIWENWKKLKTHYYKFHLSRDQKKLVKCSQCKRTFATLATYNTHMEKFHSGKKKIPGDNDEDFEPKSKKLRMSISSETDGKDKTDDKDKKKDEEGAEKSENERSDEEEDNRETESVEKEEKPPPTLKCEKCGKMFREQRRLDLHLENAHGEVQCEKCDYVAKNKYLLKSHMQQRHAEKQHTCSECGKAFARYFQLKIHLAAHARNAMYPCKVCKAEFHSHRDMRQHFNQTHALEGDKAQLKCDQCDFRCYSRTTMRLHSRKKHPEATPEEEEGADHSYFNTKPIPAPPPPPLPPPPPPSRPRKEPSLAKLVRAGRPRGRGRGGKRGGRGRGRWAAREESRLKEQAKNEKLQAKLLRRLRKNSCSRTRSLAENRLIKLDDAKNGEQNMTIDEQTDPVLGESGLLSSQLSHPDGSSSSEQLSPGYQPISPWEKPAPSPVRYSYSSRGRRRTISRPRSPYESLEQAKRRPSEDPLPESFPAESPDILNSPPAAAGAPSRDVGLYRSDGTINTVALDHNYCQLGRDFASPSMDDGGIDIMESDQLTGFAGDLFEAPRTVIAGGSGIPSSRSSTSVFSSVTGIDSLFLPPQPPPKPKSPPQEFAQMPSSSTLVSSDFRGMKATINSSGFGIKRLVPDNTPVAPQVIPAPYPRVGVSGTKPSIVSIRKVTPSMDASGQKRVIVQSIPAPYDRMQVVGQPPAPTQPLQPVTVTSEPSAGFSPSINLSRLVAALSDGEQATGSGADAPGGAEEDPNISGGSLGDLDPGLLMPEADMQDILQAAVQVLQDQEIMDSVDNIPHQ